MVPITGFANSVAAPAIEYKKEGRSLVSDARSSPSPACYTLWDFHKLVFRPALLDVGDDLIPRLLPGRQ